MTKLTGLFPAINFVPAGMVVRMMFLPRLLILLRKEGGGGHVSPPDNWIAVEKDLVKKTNNSLIII